MKLSLIAAVARNGVIGDGDKMPWHLPADLRYFKVMTQGKIVIMGRKTFESIGKPLPGRLNIVITRDSTWSAEGVKVVSGLDNAIEVGEGQALIDGVEEAVIIGGAQIYAQSLSIVDRLYLTQVEAEPEGDAHFPEIDYSQWQELGRQSFPAGDQPNRYPYSFIVYDRKEA